MTLAVQDEHRFGLLHPLLVIGTPATELMDGLASNTGYFIDPFIGVGAIHSSVVLAQPEDGLVVEAFFLHQCLVPPK